VHAAEPHLLNPSNELHATTQLAPTQVVRAASRAGCFFPHSPFWLATHAVRDARPNFVPTVKEAR